MSYAYDWCGHTPASTDEQPDPRLCGAPIDRWSRDWKHRNFELDQDHKAEPQPPVGPLEEGMFLRADRYAAAIAAAAAADERIAVLTELLRQHAWYRDQAESQLRMVQEDERFGQVWDQTGPEPEGVHALLCLTTGSVYLHNEWSQDWQLAHHDPQRAVHHSWPIEDAGPFIAWREGFDFDGVLKAARDHDTEFNELHRAWYGQPGYHDPDRGVFGGRPRLAEAYERMRREQLQRTYDANTKAQEARQMLGQLRRAIEHLRPDDVQQWPATQDNDGDLRDVEVIDLDRVLALLDRKDCGGEVL